MIDIRVVGVVGVGEQRTRFNIHGFVMNINAKSANAKEIYILKYRGAGVLSNALTIAKHCILVR